MDKVFPELFKQGSFEQVFDIAHKDLTFNPLLHRYSFDLQQTAFENIVGKEEIAQNDLSIFRFVLHVKYFSVM